MTTQPRITMANAPSPIGAGVIHLPGEHTVEPKCEKCGSNDLSFGPDAVTCHGCGERFDATCVE